MRNIEGVQVVYVQRRVCTTDVLYLLLEAAARIATENTLYYIPLRPKYVATGVWFFFR